MRCLCSFWFCSFFWFFQCQPNWNFWHVFAFKKSFPRLFYVFWEYLLPLSRSISLFLLAFFSIEIQSGHIYIYILQFLTHHHPCEYNSSLKTFQFWCVKNIIFVRNSFLLVRLHSFLFINCSLQLIWRFISLLNRYFRNKSEY